jgi:hypothetical protein
LKFVALKVKSARTQPNFAEQRGSGLPDIFLKYFLGEEDRRNYLVHDDEHDPARGYAGGAVEQMMEGSLRFWVVTRDVKLGVLLLSP